MQIQTKSAHAAQCTVKPEFEDLREPIEHKPNSRTSEFEARQIKYDIGTKILTVRARHLNKIVFCRKIENNKTKQI